MAIATFGIAKYMWPEGGATNAAGQVVTWLNVGYATVAGLVAGVLVGLIGFGPLVQHGPGLS